MEQTVPSTPTNRRGFLKASLRAAVLTLLGWFAVAQETKRRRLADDPRCIRVSACQDCFEFGGCGKSKAVETRSRIGTF